MSITTVRINVGEHGRKIMPCSEACMHMRVADKSMRFQLVNDYMVQLLNEDGSPFSSGITHGEAGIFHDEDGYYYHETSDMKIKLLHVYEDREDTPWVIIDPPRNLPELLKEWNDLEALWEEGEEPGINEWLKDKGVNIIEPDGEINLNDYR